MDSALTAPAAPTDDVLIRTWMGATDPVRLARRYLLALIFFAAAGALAALGIRVELLSPQADFMGTSAFAVLFSTHGILMFHFVLAPAFLCVLGNALVPGQIGARELAFPRLNRAACYLLVTGGVMVLLAAFTGGLPLGWMLDAPLAESTAPVRLVLTAAGIAFGGLALILTALNLATSIQTLRRPNLGWAQLPNFTWSVFLASLCVLLSSPLLLMAMGLVITEGLLKTGLFGPEAGADPLFYRKLFWLYGTPALYAIALPALGLLGDAIARHERRPDQLVRAVLPGIAALSFLLWGQHFPTADSWNTSGLLAAVTTGVMGTLFLLLVLHFARRLIAQGPPAGVAGWYLAASVIALALGALSGMTLGVPSLGRYLHNTTFMTAHVHVMTAGALLLAFFGGLHHAWPLLGGSDVAHPGLARAGLAVVLIGLLAAFGPMFLMGLGGALRREFGYAPEFQVLQVFATAGTSLLLAGMLVAILAFVPMRRAPSAG